MTIPIEFAKLRARHKDIGGEETKIKSVGLVAALILTFWLPNAAGQEPYNDGPESCRECHEAEYGVWENTKHAQAFYRDYEPAFISELLQAVGSSATMETAPACTPCHYTLVGEPRPNYRPLATAAISCESCHGPASAWLKIHDDPGGAHLRLEDESLEHKLQRINKSAQLGLVWSTMRFDTTYVCMKCHGLAELSIDASARAALVAAKHPMADDFEYLRYSLGTMSHRFYGQHEPPKNLPLSKLERARWYVIGQAAKLVAAKKAMRGVTDAPYRKVQQARADAALAVLSLLPDFPEVDALRAEPTEENGRRFADAVETMDVLDDVRDLLPVKYK